MKMRKLGSSGPEISVVGYGSWQAGGMAWGPNPPDDEVVRAMQDALDAGMNWLDTAEIYGGGHSEELVGRAVAGRDDGLVFTKLAPKPAGSGFAKADVRKGVEGSLKRLNRDHIDLYQLHWPDRSGEIEIEETWTAMAELVDEGLVRYIGVSNFGIDLMERCEKIRHVDSLQPQISLLWQDEMDKLGFCKDNGIGVICYGPLAYGLLSGAFDKDTTFTDDDWRSGKHGMDHYYNRLFIPGKYERNIEIVDQLRPIADRLNIEVSQLAIAWAFHQEGVTGAIVGSRSSKHVRSNAGAGDVELDEKDLDEINSIVSE